MLWTVYKLWEDHIVYKISRSQGVLQIKAHWEKHCVCFMTINLHTLLYI